MIKNLFFAFRFDPKGMRKAFLWELLHGLFIATPSGILLIVIWELFTEQPDTDKIWELIALMTAMLLIQLFVANKAVMASNTATYEISRKLRLALGNKLQRVSLGYYKKRAPGDLASVLLQDAANFENIFGHSVTNLANALFGLVVLSFFLVFLDWRLALSLLSAIILIIPLLILSRKVMVKQGSKQILARTRTSSRFLEYIQGIQHIKSYGLTGSRFASLEEALVTLKKASIKTEALIGPVVLTIGVILELFFLLMIWISLYYLSAGSLTTPIIIAFLIIGYRLYEPFKILMIEYPVLNYMNISLSRIREVLEAQEQHPGQQLVPQSFDITFKDVHFSYLEEKKVLEGVSFQADSGSLTALVGPSGSGKTTITSLIARFWDIQQGSISIGGVNLQDMAPQQVYKLISEVFQEVYLFEGSIYENIKIGNPMASDTAIFEAARQSQVMEFANSLPLQLDTNVGEGGSKLSGGQKQRISIARALLKDAPIVLLDEATASLDPENELYIQKAIQALVKDKTVVVIAHKLATIKEADNILVLNKGKIDSAGTHEELLEKYPQGLYTTLWNTQQQSRGWRLSGNPKSTINQEHP